MKIRDIAVDRKIPISDDLNGCVRKKKSIPPPPNPSYDRFDRSFAYCGTPCMRVGRAHTGIFTDRFEKETERTKKKKK